MNLRSLIPSNDRASVPATGGDPFEAMRREMDRLFDRFAAGIATGPAPWSLAGGPALDVAETDGAVDVAIELPGVDENDVEVSVAGDLLTISGEKRDEAGRPRERAPACRAQLRPLSADRSSCRSTRRSRRSRQRFDRGVLTVTVAKPEKLRADAPHPDRQGGLTAPSRPRRTRRRRPPPPGPLSAGPPGAPADGEARNRVVSASLRPRVDRPFTCFTSDEGVFDRCRIAQIAPLYEAVPPKLYGGNRTDRRLSRRRPWSTWAKT